MSVRVTTPEGWKNIHDCINCDERLISVTNFITYIGYGYERRNSLFFPSPNKENNSYTKQCLDHGKKYEPKAIRFVNNETQYQIIKFQCGDGNSMMTEREGLIGTVDSFVIDRETNEFGILEIKCPYGNKFGRDQDTRTCFIETESRWKHWMQLQLYGWINEIRNTTFGLLVYYYPHGGENGEPLIQINRISFIEPKILEEKLKIKSYLEEFFIKKSNKVKTKERVTKIRLIEKKDIQETIEFTKIIQKSQLQE